MIKKKIPATILIADDETAFRNLLNTMLTAEGYSVTTAADGIEAINALQAKQFDIALLDVRMPRVDGTEVLSYIKEASLDTEVIMLTGVDDVRIVVDCMKRGAYHYITKPYSMDEVTTLIERALERKQLLIENKVMKSELSRLALSSQLIGQSPAFMNVLELASKVAPTNSTVLVQGASGTGKELFAQFIHKNSERADKPFLVLNCASIPDTLIESELFGHEKGSFTDAYTARQGIVEIVNGGTLLLDEIGEISTIFQPKLLRFVQTGEYRRVGGNKTLKTDVRIISATNRNLEDEVRQGRFREDLLYRLNVITLRIPPLHERKEDIPLLVQTIIEKKNPVRLRKKVHPDSMSVLMEYDWPGNVRELENVLERAAILADDEYIRPKDLALPARFLSATNTSTGDSKVGSAISLQQLEQEHIEGVLAQTKWNKNLAAKILGISLKTLYTKIQQYQLKEK